MKKQPMIRNILKFKPLKFRIIAIIPLFIKERTRYFEAVFLKNYTQKLA